MGNFNQNVIKAPVAIVSIFLFTVFFGYGVINAQSDEESISRRQQQLEAELDKILLEIDVQSKILNTERQKGASLQRDVAILNAEIAKAQLNIKARNIAIEALGKDIVKKNETIEELNARITRNKDSLSELVRKTNELDSYSLVEVVLANSDLSEFFEDIDSFNSIQQSLQVSVHEIRQNKSNTEIEKESLNKKRLQEIDAKVSVEDEKRKIEKAEAEKKRLLNLSQQEQRSYELVVADRQKKAAEIRSALFALRDTAAIPFGQALEFANAAAAKTGVRPAFILAILTQESNLGKNVGTCNRPGDPLEKGWKVIMKPSRDQEPFKKITEELGRDPDVTPVSCPMKNKDGSQLGWGGAMGPAQFIPSTWMGYKDKVAAITGKSADPWDIRDAFVAD